MRPPARRIRRGGGGVLILLSTLPQSRGRKFASREGQSAIHRRPRRRRPELRGRRHRPCGRRRVAVIVRRRRRQQSSAGVNPWLRTGGDRVSASSPRPHVHDNSPTPSPRLRSRTRRRGRRGGHREVRRRTRTPGRRPRVRRRVVIGGPSHHGPPTGEGQPTNTCRAARGLRDWTRGCAAASATTGDGPGARRSAADRPRPPRTALAAGERLVVRLQLEVVHEQLAASGRETILGQRRQLYPSGDN